MNQQIENKFYKTGGIYLLDYKFVKNKIIIGNRLRQIDNNIVKKLADDFKINGQFHPIIVSKSDSSIHLVSGLHRLEAMKLLWKELIAQNKGSELSSYKLQAKFVNVDEKEHKILEISENLNRNDLSNNQRKELAIKYGLLTGADGIPFESSTSSKKRTPSPTNKTNQTKSWFTNWYEKSNVPKTTANNWWLEFKNANAIIISPGNANEKQQYDFFKWHKNKIENEKRQKEAANVKSEFERKQAIINHAKKAWHGHLVVITKFMNEYMSVTNTELDELIKDIQNSMRTD